MISKFEIENFKSCRSVTLDNCKRINLLIGNPNSGKSNILESFALLGHPELLFFNIRNHKRHNIFYDNDRTLTISVRTNMESAHICSNFSRSQIYLLRSNALLNGYNQRMNFLCSYFSQSSETRVSMQTPNNATPDPLLEIIKRDNYIDFLTNYPISDLPEIRFYKYNGLPQGNSNFTDYLRTPSGDNIYSIIETFSEIRSEIADLFSNSGYKLSLDPDEPTTIYIAREKNNILHKISLHQISETLKRYIFFHCAIETGKGATLLFEEPEAHSFPKYINLLAKSISKSQGRQFFITTHSPYLITGLLENTSPEEISLYYTYYENYETKVKNIPIKSWKEWLDRGEDIAYSSPELMKD